MADNRQVKLLKKDVEGWNEWRKENLSTEIDLFDWTGKHAATLRSRLAPDFTGWAQDNAKFESQFESVVEALRSDEQAREKPPEPSCESSERWS